MAKHDLIYRITADDGEKQTVCDSTPSMWADADEWVDGLMASGKHSFEWMLNKRLHAIAYLALQDNGVLDFGDLSLVSIAEMLNAFDIDVDTIDDVDIDVDTIDDGESDEAPKADSGLTGGEEGPGDREPTSRQR